MRVNKFIAFAAVIGICFGSRADIVVEVEHPDGSVEILSNPKVAPAPVLLKKAEGDSETNLKLKEFNRIVIGQGIEVNYTIGGSNEMQVYAPATLLENLSAKVRKGVLLLESLGEAPGTVKINLSAPEVKTITLTGNAVLAFNGTYKLPGQLITMLSGSSSLTFRDGVQLHELDAEVTGHSGLNFDKSLIVRDAEIHILGCSEATLNGVNAAVFTLETSGTSTATVSGKVHHGKLEANSSSHINASGMVSDSLKKVAMPLSTID